MMKNKEDFHATPRITLNECTGLNELSRLNNWRTDYRQLGAGPFETSFELYVSSNIRFTDQYCSRETSVIGIPPSGHIALVLPVNRGNKGIFQGRELGFNDIGLMAADSEYFFRSPENWRMMVVTIPVSRFNQALCAAAHGKDLRHLVTETPVIRLDNPSLASLTGSIRCALDIVQSTPQPARLAVCLQEIEEYVVTTLSLAMAGPSTPERGALARRNRLRYLERARAYIEAHPTSPLGVETLTRVTGASRRSLETAFREILNVTPVQYIRYSRLNVAKKHLLGADSTETSVTATAEALGFSHVGRFARDYHALFQELPSETLGSSTTT